MNNLRNYLSQLRLWYLKWELNNSIGTAREAEKDAKALREKIEEYQLRAENCGFIRCKVSSIRKIKFHKELLDD